MARLLGPLLSMSAWGTIAKRITFRRRKQLSDALSMPIPLDAKTALQLAQRLLFRDAVAWWHALSYAEQAAYDKPGREHHMSGYAWFIRSYLLNPPAATYLGLTDTPAAYAGEAGHLPMVNPAEDALIWSSMVEGLTGITDFPLQSCCRYYLGSNQAVATATYTVVLYDTELFDQQFEFNIATSRFTAIRPGYYLPTVHSVLVALADGKKMILFIRKNGVAIAQGRALTGSADWIGIFASTIIHLDTGDWVDIEVYHNHGSNRDLFGAENANCFSIHKLS